MASAELAAERASPPFPEQAMTDFLNGGADRTAFRNDIMAELEELRRLDETGGRVEVGYETFLDARGIMPNEDHTLDQARLQTMKMLRFQYGRLMEDAGSPAAKRQARMELMSLFDPAWFTRNGVHFGLWMSAVQGQGSQEQVNEWLPQTLGFSVFGCFAMTELGHGSFVRGLETTATYDPETHSFDIHTPRVEATKWWIGGAAKTATHAAVFAQLVLPDGSRPGVHTFIVQLRSLEDHSVMPGVRVGDCGAKMGRNGLDNGWLQFDHVKVPLEALLCKYGRVEPSGAYVPRGKKQLQYGALIGGRAIMVTDSAVWLKAATTIAVRFMALRRQGEALDSSGREPQLLDYRTVQTRVMPLVAKAYALSFVALYMQSIASPAGLVDADDSTSGGSGSLLAGSMSDEERAAALPDLHATCAGLKAFSTWACYNGIDTLRQCLGGHGYSRYTGLSRMFADFAVQCTWEGDNTVMALQTARYLVSSLERLRRGERLTGSVSYLESLPRINARPRRWKIESWRQLRTGDLHSMLDAFRYLLAKKVEHVASHNKRATGDRRRQRRQGNRTAGADAAKSELQKRQSWNDATPELLDCSRAHCMFVIGDVFVKAVEAARASQSADNRALAPSLDLLCRLYLLDSLSTWLDWFLAVGYMNRKQFFLIKEAVVKLCEETRAISVPAVDAFGLSDTLLRSPLGRRAGDVYDTYLERTRAKPGSEERAPYYETQIQPLLRANL